MRTETRARVNDATSDRVACLGRCEREDSVSAIFRSSFQFGSRAPASLVRRAMAGSNAKKRAEDNVRRLLLLQRAIFIAAGTHGVVRLGLYRASTHWLFHYPLFLFAFGAAQFCYKSLVVVGTPSWDTNGALVDGGGDLTLTGLTSYYHDIIYVCVFCLTSTSLVSDWFWFFILAIPAFATYKLWKDWILPWIFTPTSDEAEQMNRANETKEQRRKRERSEKRAGNKRGR